MCANLQVIGGSGFRKNPANFLHLKHKKEHLYRMQPIRRIFLCAGCFFSVSKFN